MRYVWKVAKAFAATSPFLFRKPIRKEDQDDEEVQTTINKIFLTSEHSEFSDLKIFAFDAEALGREVVTHLDTTLGRHITQRFNDGQWNIQILDSVRDHQVYIIKSFENVNLNEGVIQLLLAVSAMKKCGAESVTAIIPYFPYCFTTEINQGRDFYTCFASDIVKLLQQSGVSTIVTFNNPLSNPKGFANQASFINIEAPQVIVPYMMHTNIKKPVIIGSQSSQIYLRNIHKLKKTFALFDYDCDMGVFNDGQYLGQDVKGRDVLIFNNLLRTGKTLRYQSKKLKQLGARNIYFFGFHNLASHDIIQSLTQQLPITELLVTNSVYHAIENKKIRTISLAKLMAQIITVIHEEKSLRDYRAERQMMNYAYLHKIKSMNKHVKVEDDDQPYTYSYENYQKEHSMNDI